MTLMNISYAGAVLPLVLLLGGCASTTLVRHTVTLDAANIDEYRVQYLPFDGCLIKQELPLRYELQRAQYTLVFEPGFADGDRSPIVGVRVRADTAVTARFPELAVSPPESDGADYRRYAINVAELPTPLLIVELWRGSTALGVEALAVEPHRCRVWAFG